VKPVNANRELWIECESFWFCFLGLTTYSGDERLSINFEQPNNWKLRIKAVDKVDHDGLYQCQVRWPTFYLIPPFVPLLLLLLVVVWGMIKPFLCFTGLLPSADCPPRSPYRSWWVPILYLNCQIRESCLVRLLSSCHAFPTPAAQRSASTSYTTDFKCAKMGREY